MNEKIVKEALQDKRAHDFEDGMQYYSAVEAGCTVIVTKDKDDILLQHISGKEL